MDSEEREMLERSLKLAELNNRLLRDIKRDMFWGKIWGWGKIIIFVVPLVVGYFYLQPYLGPIGTSINQAKDLLESFK